MSKYIIELKDDVQVVQKVGVTENGNAFVMNFYKDQLEELNSDYINEHFGELQDTAYQRGLDEAWKAARRISVIELNGGLAGKELMKIYGTMDIHKIYDDNTASEAIAKLKAYEEKQKADDKIEVGDEVEVTKSGMKFFVTKIYEEDGTVGGLNKDGEVRYWSRSLVKRTGNHFDIPKILEAMKHD